MRAPQIRVTAEVCMPKATPLLALPVLVVACAETPRPSEADRASIDSLRAEYVAGVNGRDADLVLSGMSNDIVYLGPERAPVLGLEALGAIIRLAYEQLDPDITMTPQEVKIERPHAFEWGCLGGLIRSADGGDPITNDGKYLLLYRWTRGVGWKITHDMTSTTPVRVPEGEDGKFWRASCEKIRVVARPRVCFRLGLPSNEALHLTARFARRR